VSLVYISDILTFFNVYQYQVASRPDEMNCNVHGMLALTMDQDTETTGKPLSPFKENIRLKSIIL